MNEQGVEVGPSGIHGGRIASRAGPKNNQTFMTRFHDTTLVTIEQITLQESLPEMASSTSYYKG